MTTAFAHAADGRLGASFVTQPFGAVLAVAAGVAFWGGVHTVIGCTGIGPMFLRLLNWRTVTLGLILFAAAWGYKIVTWGS